MATIFEFRSSPLRASVESVRWPVIDTRVLLPLMLHQLL
jgi:hypothetical protein